MKTIFIDCGFHHGEGLVGFVEKGIITQGTKVYTFEPNPECKIFERVNRIKQQFDLDITGIEKAVWIRDGIIEFFQEDHTISNTGSPTDGTSNIDGWGSSVKEVNFIHLGYGNPIETPCINFSEFLKSLPESNIICKMDIEGSEYDVLRYLIKENSISLINELYVEFHERFIEHESKETESDLTEQIQSFGVKVHNWF